MAKTGSSLLSMKLSCSTSSHLTATRKERYRPTVVISGFHCTVGLYIEALLDMGCDIHVNLQPAVFLPKLTIHCLMIT